MLIEDDATMLNLLSTLFTMEGYEVEKVGTFNAIPDLVRTTRPDVILMDVHLNDVDGLEVLRLIRQDETLMKVGVVMSSGMDVRSESLANGANDFIMKPYMPDDLIAKIKLLVGS